MVSCNWLLAQVSIKFDYLHIVFPYDDTLSVRGTIIVNGKIARNSLYLSISLTVYYFAFFFAKLKKLSEQRSDLLRNKVFGAFIDIFQLFNLVHILLNVSSKSLENAKYMHEKFRRVCKRKAETQR